MERAENQEQGAKVGLISWECLQGNPELTKPPLLSRSLGATAPAVSNLTRFPMHLRHLAFISLTVASRVLGQPAAPAPAAATNETILFVGNSFMYGAGSAARYYRANTVTDLNGESQGGVPALFKVFANQAELDFTVSLETVRGSGLDLHVAKKAAVIGRAWDHVVMLGQ